MDLCCKNKFRSKNFLVIIDVFSMYNNVFKFMVFFLLVICLCICMCIVYMELYECFKIIFFGFFERFVVWRGNKIWRCFWFINLVVFVFDKMRFNFKLKC